MLPFNMLNRIQLVHYIIVFYNTRNEYTIDQVSEGLLDQHNSYSSKEL